MLNGSLRQLGDQNINKLKYFGFLGMRRVNNVVKTSIKKHARVLHSLVHSYQTDILTQFLIIEVCNKYRFLIIIQFCHRCTFENQVTHELLINFNQLLSKWRTGYSSTVWLDFPSATVGA